MFDLRPSLLQRKNAKTLTSGPLLADMQMTMKMGNPVSRIKEPKLQQLKRGCDPNGFMC